MRDTRRQKPALSSGRLILVVGAALAAVLVALVVSWAVALLLHGRNISDVGVPMYESSALALASSWVVYISLGLGLTGVVGRTLGRGTPMAYAVGSRGMGRGNGHQSHNPRLACGLGREDCRYVQHATRNTR